MNVVAIGWDRTVLELKMYFREKEAVFFSFVFPIMMLAMFSVIFSHQFSDKGDTEGVNAARFFLPGMVAAGVMLTSFQSMALSVAVERDDGTLKRLRSTPMPPVAYFLGKVGLVALTSLAQFALLIAMARLAFGVQLPTDAGHWLTFAWVFLLGVATGTVLGIAYSSLASSSRSVGAVVIAPTLILQFISGVYFAFTDLPLWLKQVASVFPLKWIAQGMRSVFFPGDWQTREMAGTWEPGRTAVVLAVWLLAGLLVCARTFRWTKRGTT
ncbi:ABC-2 type transport system permease protein [Phycicoccus badiiscoriae]|uniref:Transport permease protein n=1 Tax=Pedococcus badiiscoriae TaxID=642776 RepID=A0A852WD11_9MICO|nr:ABC transporter permease [Pedococcus badiiscoriae]NYG07043.1 ABC-2 type transport system permease protein [Pedococcus badiiscoriae]